MLLEKLFGKKKNKSDNQAAMTTPQKSSKNNENDSKSVSLEEASHSESPTKEPVAINLEKAMIACLNHENDDEDDEDELSLSKQKLFEELLFSHLFVALHSEPNEVLPELVGEQQPATVQDLNIAILKNKSDLTFSALFTSREKAIKWNSQGGKYALMRGLDVFKIMSQSDVQVLVLNPDNSPYVIIPRADFIQLAFGQMPQDAQTVVQELKEQPQTSPSSQETPQANSLEIAFPPDVFDQPQKKMILDTIRSYKNIEAVALGAVSFPNLPPEHRWVRTIFLRISEQLPSAEAQKFSQKVQQEIAKAKLIFQDVNFEVGIMPDPNFWISLHKESLVLFDKKTPLVE